MLTNKVVRNTLKDLTDLPKATVDKEYLEYSMARDGYTDVIHYVKDTSRTLTNRLTKQFRMLLNLPHLPVLRNEIPILRVPTQAFFVAASPYRVILLSRGFLDLVRFTAESIMLGLVLDRRQELDHLKLQTSDYNSLFFKIFASQLHKDPLPLPHLSEEMSNSCFAGMIITETVIHAFVLLHEIGHFELGHVKRRFLWRPQTIRNEILLVPEASNQKKAQEHEADVYAIKQAEGDKGLLLGAQLFFSLLSFVETPTSVQSNTHPYSGNRLQFLFNEFQESLNATDANDFERALSLIRETHNEWSSAPSAIFHGGNILSRLRDAYKEKGSSPTNPTEEMSAVQVYWLLGLECFADVKRRPEAYKDLLPFSLDEVD
jgi:hypothetical protein